MRKRGRGRKKSLHELRLEEELARRLRDMGALETELNDEHEVLQRTTMSLRDMVMLCDTQRDRARDLQAALDRVRVQFALRQLRVIQMWVASPVRKDEDYESWNTHLRGMVQELVDMMELANAKRDKEENRPPV